MGYNPFVSLQWMLDGKTVGRHADARRRRKCRRREEALRLYTLGSAWFSFDDDERGSLAAGQARRPRGAEQGLPHRAGRRDRLDRVAAHHGRRPHRLCGGSVRGAGGQGRGLSRLRYSITSSASASIRSGTESPSALAVLRLSTSSNLAACMIGRSAGLSPLSILPAYTPAWR